MSDQDHFFTRTVRSVLALAAMLLLVAGCASGISTKVTTFQQWPGDAQPQTYRLAEPTSEPVSRLEYSSYQDMLRGAMGSTGLVQAQGSEQARFLVSFQYRSEATQAVRREAADPFFYGGLYGGRPWGWGWGGYYHWPTWVAVSENAWRDVLVVDIRDTLRGDAEVYRSTASTVSSSPDALPQVMPYLMRAVFDGFPGNNGQVREVRYPREEK